MLALVAALSLALAPVQQLPNNPLAKVASQIGSTGLSAKAAPAKSASAFTPTGKRVYVSTFAKEYGDDAAEEKAIRDKLESYIQGYEGAAKDGGFANDAAGALGFAIAVGYSVVKGADLADAALLGLIDRVKATFDVDAVGTASNAQKQEYYEYALCLSGLVVMLAETGADAEGLKKLAGGMLTTLTGAGPEQFSHTDKAVTIKAKPAPAKPADPKPTEPKPAEPPKSTGGLAAGFSYTAPKGWSQTSQGLWVANLMNVTDSNSRTSAVALVMPAIPAGSDIGAEMRRAWNRAFPKEVADKANPMSYRRYVGDGLPAHFIFGTAKEAGRRTNSLYMLMIVDCGKQWQPIATIQSYEDLSPTMTKIGEESMARTSYTHSMPLVEDFLKSFRCPPAKNGVLVTRDALVGDYHFGTSGMTQYENIYTGSMSLNVVSYGGELFLKSDGSFTYRFVSASGFVGAQRIGNARGSGTYRVEGDLLVLNFRQYDQGDGHKVTEKRFRVGGVTRFADGTKVAVLLQLLGTVPTPLTVTDGGDWYSTRKR